jgi:hypothetical protein
LTHSSWRKPLVAGVLAGAAVLGHCGISHAVLDPDCTEHAEATVVEPPFACATLEPGQAFSGCVMRFYLKNGAECTSSLDAIDFTFLGCSEPYDDGPCASLAPGKTGLILMRGLNVGTYQKELRTVDSRRRVRAARGGASFSAENLGRSTIVVYENASTFKRREGTGGRRVLTVESIAHQVQAVLGTQSGILDERTDVADVVSGEK